MTKHNTCIRFLALWLVTLIWLPVTTSVSVASSGYSSSLRRYPYLTDTVISYATINWATDRSGSNGLVSWGKAGSESCSAHYITASKNSININGVAEYQWKAMLNLVPGTQNCYRVFLQNGIANEIDLLEPDPTPTFCTHVPAGLNQPYSFAVFVDLGYVDEAGDYAFHSKVF